VGLQAFLKVSGSKGLQLHVPLNTPVTYAQTGHFALVTAQALERAHPQLIVTDMAKVRRTWKVFRDLVELATVRCPTKAIEIMSRAWGGQLRSRALTAGITLACGRS
jgi:DNA primase